MVFFAKQLVNFVTSVSTSEADIMWGEGYCLDFSFLENEQPVYRGWKDFLDSEFYRATQKLEYILDIKNLNFTFQAQELLN